MWKLFNFPDCFLSSYLLLLIVCNENTVKVHSLSTNSRWIVDESGHRVKLACLNWPSHLEVMVAEGLNKQPLDEICKRILDIGFNCVRLTWPLFLFTNDTLASLTVRQSFKTLGLIESISGFQTNNPEIIDLSLINSYQAVVSSISKNDLMIILDNHVSKPGWCCSNSDGNGFFGDEYFDPDLWIKGLIRVATIFKNTNNVIGMSLRNELRGPRQNENDWFRYMQEGAEAVHVANPNVLVILSGLSFDKDLSFLGSKQVEITFTNKLVFEVHWYSFTEGEWVTRNVNQVCGQEVNNTMRRVGFLLDQGYPLFVSEFGVDMRGTNVNDNRYLNCFLGWAAEFDVDWAFWVLGGSYYLREGVKGFNETYGILDWNWYEISNSSFKQRILALKPSLQGPNSPETCKHSIIFHPMTGLCVNKRSLLEPLTLGPCSEALPWRYKVDKTLTIKGTYLCLQAQKLGHPAKIGAGLTCGATNSKWEAISDSKMHVSSVLHDGVNACMDIDFKNQNILITNRCKCLDRNDTKCDPASQWFKIIDNTQCGIVKSFIDMNSILKLVKNLL